jgi:von Willebrand factor type A domain
MKLSSQKLIGFLAPVVLLIFCLGLIQISAQSTRNRRTGSPSENPSAPPEPTSLDVIRVDSNLVSVPVIVSDREGRYIPNLSIEKFKLFDNDSEQRISYFDAADEPLNVALLLDTSRSTEGVLDEIKKGAKSFIKELRPQDRAMIVTFDYEIHRLSGLTDDRKVLEKAIKEAKVGQYVGTVLNDCVSQLTNQDFKSVTGRKAIILLSDGDDHGSVLLQDELLKDESEADAMVYSIYYASDFRGFRGRPNHDRFPGRFPGPSRFPGRFPGGRPFPVVPQNGTSPQWPGRGQRRNDRRYRGPEFLRELSEVTSGRYYESERTDLERTFGLIAEELRHQYRLGFYPAELQKDGTVHLLKVRVDATDVAVRARQQYRAQSVR